MSIKNISIFFPERTAYFEVGQKLIIEEKESDIEVLSISVFFSRIKVKLSNGEAFYYYNLPYYTNLKK